MLGSESGLKETLPSQPKADGCELQRGVCRLRIINAAHGNKVICSRAVSEVFTMVHLVCCWGVGRWVWGAYVWGVLGASVLWAELWDAPGEPGTRGTGEQGCVPEEGWGVRSHRSLSRLSLT